MITMPRVAVLVDLPREAASGGHVKYWERMAQAAVTENAPIDLTIYFSGSQPEEILSPHVRFRFLPPVFSTSKLKFLPYVPAHTDLAPFHACLAQELGKYDVIHTTEGCFAFTRTAEFISRWKHIPLVTSFHTDTPAYAEIFTQQTIEHIFGSKVGPWFDRLFSISGRERKSKMNRLKTHLRKCSAILAMRTEDIALARTIVTPDKIKSMRIGVDKDLFSPLPDSRPKIEQKFAISSGKFFVLFVGRIDAGKNIHTLALACAAAILKGVNLHLIVAGLGPLSDEVTHILGENVTLAGLVKPYELSELYAAVDCLAIASDIEIGGMIGVEALACGCPVLVSCKSGVAQACGNPRAMKMVESGVEPWTEALVAFAKDTTLKETMREAALAFRSSAIAGWNDVLMDDFIPVWQSVAGSHSK